MTQSSNDWSAGPSATTTPHTESASGVARWDEVEPRCISRLLPVPVMSSTRALPCHSEAEVLGAALALVLRSNYNYPPLRRKLNSNQVLKSEES
jgi:hypothetical protein